MLIIHQIKLFSGLSAQNRVSRPFPEHQQHHGLRRLREVQTLGQASNDGTGHGPQDPLLRPQVEPDPGQERDRLAVQRVRTNLDEHPTARKIPRND